MVNTIDYIELGKTIKTIRGEKNLTQEKLAELTNMSTTHISNIENGKAKVSLETILNISRMLEYSIEELISGDIHKSFNKTKSQFKSIISDCNYYELKIINDVVLTLINSLRKNK